MTTSNFCAARTYYCSDCCLCCLLYFAAGCGAPLPGPRCHYNAASGPGALLVWCAVAAAPASLLLLLLPLLVLLCLAQRRQGWSPVLGPGVPAHEPKHRPIPRRRPRRRRPRPLRPRGVRLRRRHCWRKEALRHSLRQGVGGREAPLRQGVGGRRPALRTDLKSGRTISIICMCTCTVTAGCEAPPSMQLFGLGSDSNEAPPSKMAALRALGRNHIASTPSQM